MSLEELKSYEYQLEQVSLALEKDPSNAELQKLSSDLVEIITLLKMQFKEELPTTDGATESLSTLQSPISQHGLSPGHSHSTLGVTGGTSLPVARKSKKNADFPLGNTVMARWSGDGQFYKAQIVSKGKDGLYSLEFSGYSTVELVHSSDIRELGDPELERLMEKAKLDKNKGRPKASDKDGKRKKGKDTKPSVQGGKVEKAKSVELVKQQAWLSFTKSAHSNSKKSKLFQSLTKKSMFASPDEPEGKVGVVGSGRPMTTFAQRGKHIYEGK